MMWFAHSALSPAHVLLAAPPLFCLYKSKDAIPVSYTHLTLPTNREV